MAGLLDLPTEVRLRIYQYLPEPGWNTRIRIERGFRAFSNTYRMNVMRINSQIYREIWDASSQNLHWWFAISVKIAEVDELRDVLAEALNAIRVQRHIRLARSFTIEIVLDDKVYQWAKFKAQIPDIDSLVRPMVHPRDIFGHWLRWFTRTSWPIIHLPQSLKTFSAAQRWPVSIHNWDASHDAPGLDFARFIERYAKWSNRRRDTRPAWRRPSGRAHG